MRIQCSTMGSRCCLNLALLICLSACSPAQQQVDFASARLSTTAELQPTIRGYIAKPEGSGPFPAVVLLHGCGGIASNAREWGDWFRNKGFVALLVDSFTPRGVNNICNQLGRVELTDRMADAFGGLDYLAQQAFVDRNRVVVMGFSNGGAVTLAVAAPASWISRPANSARFRAAIGMYPECLRYTMPNEPPPSIPLLILVGALDDWTPAATCQRLADKNRGKGAPITLMVLPGARHAFDASNLPFTRLPAAMNINSATGFGATVEGNSMATVKSREIVDQFLNATLTP